MSNSIQISIRAGEELQEILISQLSEYQVSGFEQTDTHLIAYFPELEFNSYDIQNVLEGYEYELLILEEKNWNEEWEQNFHPIIIDGFCRVRASFHQPDFEVPFDIIITPKMSFGTGHHATTYMMMDHMKEMELKGKKVLDFGTGTGILAILAEKCGASAVTGIDVDEWSIANASENVESNQCTKISLEQTTNLPNETFDNILANINLNVILEYLPELKNRLNAGGILMLSGLLVADREVINEACKASGLKFVKENEKSGWLSFIFSN